MPAAPADTVGKNVTKGLQNLADSLKTITPEKFGDIQHYDWSALAERVGDALLRFGFKLVLAVAVFLAGRFIINRLYAMLRAILLAHDVDRSLSSFLLSMVRITLLFILVVVVIGILGIETSSFIAIFASAGFAVGMALSGTLQNFAGGVLILLLKPYKVGDYIEYETHKGVVREIQIFHTVVTTLNNEAVIIPNGPLSTGTVNNYTREAVRRLEWRVAISYGDSVDTARKVIMDIFAKEPKLVTTDEQLAAARAERDGIELNSVGNADGEADTELSDEQVKRMPWYRRLFHRHRQLKARAAEWRDEKLQKIEMKASQLNVAPSVNVESLDDSAVTLVARAWCRSGDYWSALYAVNEAIYKQLPQHGLSFPFPQLDLHISNQATEQ